MTLQVVAGFLGQAGLQHPALLYRNMVGALAGKRSGFFRYNDFTLTPSASVMSINIGAGDAVLMGTEAVTTQGGYYAWNNATETLAWPASTSLPRVDSLILRVIDTDYGADAAGSKAVWEIVSGTAAASPVAVADSAFAPAGAFYHPGAWLRVADFTVPASATNLAAATISHKRKYARIGRHTIGLSTDFPGDAQLGDQFTVIDGATAGSFYFYNGTTWVLTGGPRTSFVPTLISSGTQPGMGTASVRNGWYAYGPGPSVTYNFFIRFGTTGSTPGTGTYTISLPVPVAAQYAVGHPSLGSVLLSDTSAGAFSSGVIFGASSATAGGLVVQGGVVVSATTPWTWDNSDYLSGQITYPV